MVLGRRALTRNFLGWINLGVAQVDVLREDARDHCVDHFHGVRRPDLQQVHQQPFNYSPIDLFHGQIMEWPEKIPDDTLIPLLYQVASVAH